MHCVAHASDITRYDYRRKKTPNHRVGYVVIEILKEEKIMGDIE